MTVYSGLHIKLESYLLIRESQLEKKKKTQSLAVEPDLNLYFAKCFTLFGALIKLTVFMVTDWKQTKEAFRNGLLIKVII